MKEREDIISSIQKNLWEIQGVKLVERNLREMAILKQFPSIFLIDRGDDVEAPMTRPVPEYRRVWSLCIASIIQGTSDEAAIQELAEFQKNVKLAVYKTNKTVGRLHKGFITETSIEPVAFLSIGNCVVAQGINFEIHYVESLSSR